MPNLRQKATSGGRYRNSSGKRFKDDGCCCDGDPTTGVADCAWSSVVMTVRDMNQVSTVTPCVDCDLLPNPATYIHSGSHQSVRSFHPFGVDGGPCHTSLFIAFPCGSGHGIPGYAFRILAAGKYICGMQILVKGSSAPGQHSETWVYFYKELGLLADTPLPWVNGVPIDLDVSWFDASHNPCLLPGSATMQFNA